MSLGPPLHPDEIVYRRIAARSADDAQWIDENCRVDANAFRPNSGDADGLSLTRASSPEVAAAGGRLGKEYYIVAIRVGDLINVPVCEDSPTHALIPNMTYNARKTDAVREAMEQLSQKCSVVSGPYPGTVDVE